MDGCNTMVLYMGGWMDWDGYLRVKYREPYAGANNLHHPAESVKVNQYRRKRKIIVQIQFYVEIQDFTSDTSSSNQVGKESK